MSSTSFRPHSDARRFRVVQVTWEPTLDSVLNGPGPSAELQRKIWEEKLSAFPLPSHLVEIPDNEDLWPFQVDELSASLTRNNALRAAAELNRGIILGADFERFAPREWFIVIEMGFTETKEEEPDYVYEGHGVGYFEGEMVTRFRLVECTDAERDRYGATDYVTAALEQSAELVKGGAA